MVSVSVSISFSKCSIKLTKWNFVRWIEKLLVQDKKFCSVLWSESRSWFSCGFQYQTYISYIDDTHQILFGSANSFESYCVHNQNPRTARHQVRQTNRQTDIQTYGIFFPLFLCSKAYKIWTFIKRRDLFFHSCDYNTFSFYILRMWWDSKNNKIDTFWPFIWIL